jgi:hypothetical protein
MVSASHRRPLGQRRGGRPVGRSGYPSRRRRRMAASASRTSPSQSHGPLPLYRHRLPQCGPTSPHLYLPFSAPAKQGPPLCTGYRSRSHDARRSFSRLEVTFASAVFSNDQEALPSSDRPTER